MFVSTYMKPNPVTVSPDDTFPQAMSLIRKHKIRRLPVLEAGRLVGIIEEKDLLSNQPSQATTLSVFEIYSLLEHLRVRQMMSKPVVTVEGDCPIEEAARIMIERGVGCLPVMKGEELVGIITETDIFKVLVEVLGGQDTGCRITLFLPERVGELAAISSQIANTGGNIIAFTSSRLLENGVREVTIKESGADTDILEKSLHSQGIEVIDIRTISKYEPRLFG
jgi:acetoin utilization protein AcuB